MNNKMKCLLCKKEFKQKQHANNQKYCSAICRRKVEYKRKGGAEFQREYLQKKALRDGKPRIQCKICDKWFRQVGSHIVQIHQMTAREYREEFGFDVKRGQLPDDYRQIKAEYVFENGTVNNLKKGKKYWFEKGDKKAGRYQRSQQTMERLKQQSFIKKAL